MFQLSEGDIAMVERARAAGASAKFAGSGGAIIGTYPDDAIYDRLVQSFADTGTEVFKPTIR
jgi:glucuronokinase